MLFNSLLATVHDQGLSFESEVIWLLWPPPVRITLYPVGTDFDTVAELV